MSHVLPLHNFARATSCFQYFGRYIIGDYSSIRFSGKLHLRRFSRCSVFGIVTFRQIVTHLSNFATLIFRENAHPLICEVITTYSAQRTCFCRIFLPPL